MLLNDLLVLDLADGRASFCSKLLADMGARVVKIERPGGDASRWEGPFWQDEVCPERSLFFWHNNTNKLGITLNLESDEGKLLFYRLIGKADVVVESYSPGYLEELNLGYKSLTEKNQRLVLASITDFGQSGPYHRYSSCDIVASALGGQMYVCGASDTPPLKPYGEQSYYAASLFAAVGILVALRERSSSGKGQYIDVSIQEAVTATLEHVMVRYFYDNVVPGRTGNLYWNNSCCILPCKDGHIMLTFSAEWETLVELMDKEGMAEDLKEERWCDEGYRIQHREHIVELLEQWTRLHTVDELFTLGQSMRFPWAPVCSIDEVVSSPQLGSRNFFTQVSHPELDSFFNYPGSPYKSSCFDKRTWKRAPMIGEDNAQVYTKELGISAEELAKLSARGII